MPDWFQPDPERSHFDNSPRDEAVPVAGISDAPAHIAIVNQQWVAFILGAIDRLGYGDVWAGSDADRENAYHQILELEAMLMSPANYLIPSDTFSFAVNQLNLPAGAPTGTLFTVPTGKVYKVTEIGIMHTSATISATMVFASEISVQRFLMHELNPASLQMYARNVEYWIRAGGSINWQVVNATAGDDLRAHVNGLVYDTV